MTGYVPISEILEGNVEPEIAEMVRKGIGLLKEQEWRDAREQFGAIARQYTRHGAWLEAACLYEELATNQSKWEEAKSYLRQAISYYNRADQMEACVRCHRRMRELVPKNLSPRRLLEIWRPAGVVVAYPHIGAAEEAVSQLRTLGTAVIEWPIWERFQYHLALSNIYRELKEWDKVGKEGRQFVTWARAIPENDPALL